MAWRWTAVVGWLKRRTAPDAVELHPPAPAEAPLPAAVEADAPEARDPELAIEPDPDHEPKPNPSDDADPAMQHDNPEPSPRQALSDVSNMDEIQAISKSRRSETGRVARVYAQALVEMGDESGRLDEIATEVRQLRGLISAQAGLRDLLTTPALGVDERTGVIERVFRGRLSDTTYRFLQVVNAKGRLDVLPSVLEAFEEALAERQGIVEADVYVAQRLDPAAAEQVANRIGAALKKRVVVHQYVNPELIGGLVIRVGDQLIDGSVATQLKNLREKLVEAGREKARQQAQA